MNLIAVRELEKSLGKHRAVAGIGFSVPRSTIVGLVGSNGAGKTTTMRMLAGCLTPDGGQAHIAGFDIVRERRRAQSALGYLPEAANGFALLTVWEFLIFGAEFHGLRGGDGREAAARVMDLLGLKEAACRPLESLSKGWRQRAWLAQALINDPPVLILDEPTDGLDPNQKVELRALLRHLAKDRAILMTTHIVEEAEELCDRLIVMQSGSIVADAPRKELADSRGRLTPALLRLTSDGPVRDIAPSCA